MARSMVIQFQCTGCSEPIEVDDDLAGASAACPYCGRVCTVPRESTFRPAAVAVARPAGGMSDTAARSADARTRGAAADAERDAPEVAARRLGRASMMLSIASLALFVATMLYVATLVLNDPVVASQSPPTQRDLAAAVQRLSAERPYLGLPFIVVLVTAVLGLTAGLASMRGGVRTRAGLIGVIISGVLTTCFVGEIVAWLAGVGPGS